MEGFVKKKEMRPEEKWDARQRLVVGWDADAIRRATILVIGAGAIGNETIKNLALLGFGNTIICDMDTVETSNLTRTALFSQDDIGKKKAPLAAKRMREMNLEKTSCVDSFDGDVVYALGDGVFRRATVVLGCLDNVETRMHVNKVCMRYGIPYIDAGIGSLSCTVQVMNGHEYGCYACYAEDYKFEDRFRQSCDITKRKAAAVGKMATVQTTSAIVSGIQVQEALKIVCGMNPQYGIEIHYQGISNLFNRFNVGVDPNCICHMLNERHDIQETPLSYQDTLRDFLTYVKERGYDVLSVQEDKLRNFVLRVKCPSCGKERLVMKPLFQVFMDDFYCNSCREDPDRTEQFWNDMDELSLYTFSLDDTPPEILDLSLRRLGFPAFEVLSVSNSRTREQAYFELTGDFPSVLPSYYVKHTGQ